MRSMTREDVLEQKLLLSQLKDAWISMNKSYIDSGLKNSLYTRILEVRSSIEDHEEKERRNSIPKIPSRRGRKKRVITEQA